VVKFGVRNVELFAASSRRLDTNIVTLSRVIRFCEW
jgi:hypothetical protein